jgi:hypothetical protein
VLISVNTIKFVAEGDQLQCGDPRLRRALARVLLLLISAGDAASYLNQPIEVHVLRPKPAAVASRPPKLIRQLEGGWQMPLLSNPKCSSSDH